MAPVQPPAKAGAARCLHVQLYDPRPARLLTSRGNPLQLYSCMVRWGSKVPQEAKSQRAEGSKDAKLAEQRDRKKLHHLWSEGTLRGCANHLTPACSVCK